MNLKLKIVIVLVPFLVVCCTGETGTEPKNNNYLFGAWVEESYENSIRTLAREDGLDSNKYGYIFYSDGTLIERKNSGWCGTPPINYANFAGTWIKSADSTYRIDVDYWGGETTYEIEIVSITGNELKLKYHWE